MLKQFWATALPIAMVFKGVIDSVTRAHAYYLCRVKGLSVRTVNSMSKISASSVYRIAHEKSYETHFGGDV